MPRALADLLFDAPERVRREYLSLSDDIQNALARYIEQEGQIPRRPLFILFGPERQAVPDPNRWMLR